MNDRLVRLLVVFLLTAVNFAEAQQLRKTPRIGFLALDLAPEREGAFWKGLQDLGYVEGTNVRIEWRSPKGKPDQLAELALELVKLKVDVIVTADQSASLAAQKITNTIPIVMVTSRDPVAAGLVASFSRPGANTTGLTAALPEFSNKRLELIKETIPSLSKLAVLFNPSLSDNVVHLKQIRSAAKRLIVWVEDFEVKKSDELESTLNALAQRRLEALMVFRDPLINSKRRSIVEFANKRKMPALYDGKAFADAGGLISYGVDVSFLFDGLPVTLTRSLRAPNLLISRLDPRLNSIWSST